MSQSIFKNKVVLITGGTGSFGQAMTRYLLEEHDPSTVRIFSRDEYKQYRLREKFPDKRLRLFLGDVRDRHRLRRACEGADIILNAAALKQVPVCEYNPFEAIQTNIMGAMNVVDAAIDCGVSHVMTISSDKAVNPVNLYGATKLCAEKVFIYGNSYSGRRQTRLACVRYGNVVGSRGSVLPLFLQQAKQGEFTITDERMTRFWISLDAAVRFVTRSLEMMVGGEIFVPRLPSMRVVDLARTIAPKATLKSVGVRPGEKLHEVMVMREEACHTISYLDGYIILPEWFNTIVKRPYLGKTMDDDFYYSSDSNDWWMTRDEMTLMIKNYTENPDHHCLE